MNTYQTKPIWKSDLAAVEIIFETLEGTNDLTTREELLNIAGKLVEDAVEDIKSLRQLRNSLGTMEEK